ncbi:uncharacterized protein LOC130960920 isoform X1 [Arachis stenosperma]|uniref:uncharacterized protein LOC130960920 isoform X1 n=1 Tax=Arachis stenosperma TaxID=217475 RepID=UPI0025AB8779|nr:uncharacterized protein LOC130960920 isoform X1 [Arachis stenosperma]
MRGEREAEREEGGNPRRRRSWSPRQHRRRRHRGGSLSPQAAAIEASAVTPSSLWTSLLLNLVLSLVSASSLWLNLCLAQDGSRIPICNLFRDTSYLFSLLLHYFSSTGVILDFFYFLLIVDLFSKLFFLFSSYCRLVFKADNLGWKILSTAVPFAMALTADPIASLVDTTFIGRIGSLSGWVVAVVGAVVKALRMQRSSNLFCL